MVDDKIIVDNTLNGFHAGHFHGPHVNMEPCSEEHGPDPASLAGKASGGTTRRKATPQRILGCDMRQANEKMCTLLNSQPGNPSRASIE
jgi:hypothetical protein